MTENGYTFSNSERRAFVSCERRWNYRYKRGWEPRLSSVPLMFGRLWDDALNVVYEYVRHVQQGGAPAIRGGQLAVIADMLHEEVCDGPPGSQAPLVPGGVPDGGVLGSWVAGRAAELSAADEHGWPDGGPPWSMADVWENEGTFRSMLRMYLDEYLVPDIEGLEVLAVQPTLRAHLRTLAGNASWKYSYAGIPDQVVRDPDSGLVWILEQKSTGMAAVSRERDLRVDPQGLSYCWLLWRAAGVPLEQIGGVIYSIARRKEPSQPKRLKCKKKPKCPRCAGSTVVINATGGDAETCPACRGTGQNHEDCEACIGDGYGGLSKAECDTTPAIYSEAICNLRHAGWNDPEYENVLARLEARKNRWLHRFSVRVHADEIRGLEREVYQTGRIASDALRRETMDSPRNVGACMVAGRSCSYVPLCRTGSGFDGTAGMAEAYGFVKRPKLEHHGEPNLWQWGE